MSFLKLMFRAKTIPAMLAIFIGFNCAPRSATGEIAGWERLTEAEIIWEGGQQFVAFVRAGQVYKLPLSAATQAAAAAVAAANAAQAIAPVAGSGGAVAVGVKAAVIFGGVALLVAGAVAVDGAYNGSWVFSEPMLFSTLMRKEGDYGPNPAFASVSCYSSTRYGDCRNAIKSHVLEDGILWDVTCKDVFANPSSPYLGTCQSMVDRCLLNTNDICTAGGSPSVATTVGPESIAMSTEWCDGQVTVPGEKPKPMNCDDGDALKGGMGSVLENNPSINNTPPAPPAAPPTGGAPAAPGAGNSSGNQYACTEGSINYLQNLDDGFCSAN